eukprot:1680633-Amphidinium_carterae.1
MLVMGSSFHMPEIERSEIYTRTHQVDLGGPPLLCSQSLRSFDWQLAFLWLCTSGAPISYGAGIADGVQQLWLLCQAQRIHRKAVGRRCRMCQQVGKCHACLDSGDTQLRLRKQRGQ